jgi:NAD-dependent DNA ligase
MSVSQTPQERIEQRRRQLLVHGCLYYRLNTNIIDDSTYDRWSKELVELQTEYPEAAKQASFHDAFEDFDGSSGFDLPTHLPEIVGRARWLLNYRGRTNE